MGVDDRIGREIPGIGTVFDHGPDDGTYWAVTGSPDVAGVVYTPGLPGKVLTREEQARRLARADRIVRESVVLALHDVPDGVGPHGEQWTRRQVQVHLTGCEALTGAVKGSVTRVQRLADVTTAALRGRCYRVRYGLAGKTAAWCPTCFGRDTP